MASYQNRERVPMQSNKEKPDPKIFWALEAGAILLSFGVLYVGMTVAEGLESSAVAWGAKILAVVVLALLFSVVRRARHRDQRDRREAKTADPVAERDSHAERDSDAKQASDSELIS